MILSMNVNMLITTKRWPAGSFGNSRAPPLGEIFGNITNFKPSLKSKHEDEYECEHADHHKMVCLNVMSSRFLLFFHLIV
jgi:hypothetical protein